MTRAATLFDLLRAAQPLTVAEMIERTGWTCEQLRNALQALRDYRRLACTCENKVWRYKLSANADRPLDRRGRRPAPTPTKPRTSTPARRWNRW